jgi:acyl carrier protein
MVRPLAASLSKGEKLREQVQERLHDWFTSRGKIGREASQNMLEIDYFAAGWLSSMEVVEFVTDIESQFGMQFSEADLQDVRFATISGLADLILERSTQSAQSR